MLLVKLCPQWGHNYSRGHIIGHCFLWKIQRRERDAHTKERDEHFFKRLFIQDAEVEGLFKNLKHKMNEEDIYKLYDNKNPNTFFEDDKLQRLLKFLKCI